MSIATRRLPLPPPLPLGDAKSSPTETNEWFCFVIVSVFVFLFVAAPALAAVDTMDEKESLVLVFLSVDTTLLIGLGSSVAMVTSAGVAASEGAVGIVLFVFDFRCSAVVALAVLEELVAGVGLTAIFVRVICSRVPPHNLKSFLANSIGDIPIDVADAKRCRSCCEIVSLSLSKSNVAVPQNQKPGNCHNPTEENGGR